MEATTPVGVADHPALELLNSTVHVGAGLDALGDGDGLLRWLVLTGQLTGADAAGLRARFGPAALDDAAAQARELREWLRPRIAAWARQAGYVPGPPAPDPSAPDHSGPGSSVPDEVVDRVNEVLARDTRHPALVRDGGLRLGTAHRWSGAGDLVALPAAAVAELLAEGDPALVRHCEGAHCTLWFYDRTRNHRRRWCSMALCGNRAKALTHRARHAAP